jgi:hypothetical protein
MITLLRHQCLLPQSNGRWTLMIRIPLHPRLLIPATNCKLKLLHLCRSKFILSLFSVAIYNLLMIRYYEYESDSEGECPPTPEPLPLDSQYYCCGDECFNSYLENCPEYANIALEHYNSQQKHEVNCFNHLRCISVWNLLCTIIKCRVIFISVSNLYMQ